jgi:hypothetical protein
MVLSTTHLFLWIQQFRVSDVQEFFFFGFSTFISLDSRVEGF